MVPVRRRYLLQTKGFSDVGAVRRFPGFPREFTGFWAPKRHPRRPVPWFSNPRPSPLGFRDVLDAEPALAGGQRQRGGHERAAAGRALDLELAAEGGHPVALPTSP
jgi:hypothetical protein